MQKFYSRGLLACFSLITLISCQDFDGGFDSDTIKKASYAKDFEKTFGKIDPNQDWSMASTLQANVTVGSNPSVVIYSEKPGYAGSTVLGLVNGKSATFNGLKGAEQVYAVVIENGNKLVSGYYNVENGMVNINNQPVAKRSIMTRAAGDPTIGDEWFTQTCYDQVATWDGKTYHLYYSYSYEQQVYLKQEGDEWFIYHTPNAATTPFRKLAHNGTEGYTNYGYNTGYTKAYYADGAQEEAIGNLDLGNRFGLIDGKMVWLNDAKNGEGSRVEVKVKHDATYYHISGETKTTNVTWKIGDCQNLFWDANAFFLEGQDYRGTTKRALYETQGVTVADLEAPVVYTTKTADQEINIPMMFGATQNANVLGYYYYTDDEDPRDVNRYVLYEDAKPTSNITVNGTALPRDMRFENKGDYQDDYVVSCTSRRLVYFDENGNGSFQFPANVHIGFFIIRQAHSVNPQVDADGHIRGTMCETGWAYSDPTLNYASIWQENGLGNNVNAWYYRPAKSEFDTTKGNVKAITWEYDGRILVGFGDDSGDFDLNDFVFWVDGDFKEEPKIKITTESLETSWIFACEDLGGTFDYDFNDVVWEVAQKYEDTYTDGEKTGTTYGNIEIRLLAAGGTLPVELVYNDESLGEVHQQLAGAAAASLYTPVNITAPKATYAPKVVKTINATTQMDISTLKGSFKLKVKGADGQAYYVTTPDANEHNSGDAKPQIILLPATWEWPIENKCIKDAYPGFTNWANNATANDWLSNKTTNAWYVKKK